MVCGSAFRHGCWYKIRHGIYAVGQLPYATGGMASSGAVDQFIRMRGQECKNAGRPLLERSGLPEPLHQELFKLGCSRYPHAMAIVSTHILKVFADGGPGEGAFIRKSSGGNFFK